MTLSAENRTKRGEESITLDPFCNPELADLARSEAAHARATFPQRTNSVFQVVYRILESSREARNDRRVLLEKVQAALGNQYRSPDGIFRRAREIQNGLGRFRPDFVSAAVRSAEEESERERASNNQSEQSE